MLNPILVNIDSKGYGKIYKAVMRDRDLPILAKSIYAYFCSFAGLGRQAYPKRDKIVRDLQINKDTYTKYLALLVNRGYITKERTATGNLYTIQQTIPVYNFQDEKESELTDTLVFENVAAHGFGTVPKLVMLDQNLTSQAKAIYAYFASFSGMGTTSFPRRATILRELKIGSLSTYYRHFNLLIEKGYLSIEQRKNGGRFDICIYRLHSMVCSDQMEKTEHIVSKGTPDKSMSEKSVHGGKRLESPQSTSEKPLSEKVISEKMGHQKPGQANNRNSNIINSSFNEEQENNHQGILPVEFSQPSPIFTAKEVMERIHYTQLQADISSWGQLMRDTLHRFQTPADEQRYYHVMQKILSELVSQLTELLNQAKEPGRILEKMSGSAFSNMFDDLLARWNGIHNVPAYIAASLNNLISH